MQNDDDLLGRLLAAASETDEEMWKWVCQGYGMPTDTLIPAVEDAGGDVVVAE